MFRYNKYPSFKLNLLVFIIPIITLLLVSTNDYHGLYYTSISTIEYNGYLLADFTRGIWYYVFIAFGYLTLVYGIIVFYSAWKSSYNQRKSSALWMLTGSISLWAINICYILGLSPKGIDLTPFGFLFVAITYYIAIFRYDLLELKSIIRSIVFSEINEGIIVVDGKKRIIDFNNSAQKTFKWLKTSIIGESISSFEEAKKLLKSNPKEHEHENENELENGYEFEYEVEITRNGKNKYFKFQVTAIKENNITLGHVYIFQDISKQKEMIKNLNYLADNDSLTKIFNRRKFMEEAEKEFLRYSRYGGHISVLMIDIDNFKRINDDYGHLAGDDVLVGIVNECKSRIRETDIIGRYGGEEFAVVLPETDSQGGLMLSEEIRQRIANLDIKTNEGILKATVSIGVATASKDKSIEKDSNDVNSINDVNNINGNDITNVEKLIDLADKALYKAKKRGRNQTQTL